MKENASVSYFCNGELKSIEMCLSKGIPNFNRVADVVEAILINELKDPFAIERLHEGKVLSGKALLEKYGVLGARYTFGGQSFLV